MVVTDMAEARREQNAQIVACSVSQSKLGLAIHPGIPQETTEYSVRLCMRVVI